ncbi:MULTISPECIES: hypothetical protein [Pseudoalteromonas]|uniref:Uncharacterized protein n=1 Tax=Pseudoalteromonas amylolytica TaxID=1859457 RepID=A0A1S1MQ03_9GAMM|nr:MULTISPECIES: hypothetical protein [Pseudoalteromonas]OHU84391.1 hypothetical protein BFC16_01765 [Pseudoalteromonas sp. JW3]OHU87069.1 hypothetical protein BET10_00170 [Pseudoalteromonas amylolytica]
MSILVLSVNNINLINDVLLAHGQHMSHEDKFKYQSMREYLKYLITAASVANDDDSHNREAYAYAKQQGMESQAALDKVLDDFSFVSNRRAMLELTEFVFTLDAFCV